MSIIEKANSWARNNPIKFIIISIVLIGMSIQVGSNKGNSIKRNNTKNKSSSATTNCIGDESCISQVRDRFRNMNKTILGEQYIGSGVFGISFLDLSRGVSANAKVSTDCNCQILDISVSVMR